MSSQSRCKHSLLLEDWGSRADVLICAYCSKQFQLNQLDVTNQEKTYDNANLIDILTTKEDAEELCSRGCFSQSSLDEAMIRAERLFNTANFLRPRIKFREILAFCIFQQLCKEQNVQNPKTICRYFQIHTRKLWNVQKHVVGFGSSNASISDFIHCYASLMGIRFKDIKKMVELSHEFPMCGSVNNATLAACIIVAYCRIHRNAPLIRKSSAVKQVSEVSTLSESNLRKKILQYNIVQLVKKRLEK